MEGYTESIILSAGTHSLSYDSSYVPFTINIDPKLLLFSNKIRSIEYSWGDGNVSVVNYKPIDNFSGNLPFPYDVGSPLNYPQKHTFYSKDINTSIYEIIIKVNLFGNSNYSIFKINLNLKNPDIRKLFSEFHLIKTRMFGRDNEILYTFQTQNPNYILMSTVKWKDITKENILKNGITKKYTFIPPFENSLTSFIPQNSAIINIPYKNVPINLDTGVVE